MQIVVTDHVVEDAVARFQAGHSCSQAVFSAFAVPSGMDESLALKITCPFGGGMARMGEVCGAVTGAFMVIGIKFGRADVEDEQARDATYSAVEEFIRLFKKRHDVIRCRDLLGIDPSDSQQKEQENQGGLLDTLCTRIVRDAAEIVCQIVQNK